jgi:hypothetical protein
MESAVYVTGTGEFVRRAKNCVWNVRKCADRTVVSLAVLTVVSVAVLTVSVAVLTAVSVAVLK